MKVPHLKLNHREADPRIALHTIFASLTNEPSAVCVAADDMDGYILLLLYRSQYCSGEVYFGQCTGSSNHGITYHDLKSLANYLGEPVCKIMPAFHALK